jgi:hypothetical protein
MGPPLIIVVRFVGKRTGSAAAAKGLTGALFVRMSAT